MSEGPAPAAGRSQGWDESTSVPGDGADEEVFKRLTAEEAEALRKRTPVLSPWKVIAIQSVAGVLVALVGWLVSGRADVAWSLLYGAAAAVVPGALMAYGMTRRRHGRSPGALAVSFMSWELAKIGVSVAMLGVANWILQPPVWLALLAGLVVALKMYWVALLWQRRSTG